MAGGEDVSLLLTEWMMTMLQTISFSFLLSPDGFRVAIDLQNRSAGVNCNTVQEGN